MTSAAAPCRGRSVGSSSWRGRCSPSPIRGEIRSLALAVVLVDDERDHGLYDDPTPCARIVGVDDEDGVKVLLHRNRMDEVELFMLELEPAPRIKKIRDSYFMLYKKYDTVYFLAQ